MMFDEYMHNCLYGPDGFYTKGRGAGRKGADFITSPEVGPLFGTTIANCIDQSWKNQGRPDPFKVFDIGCGPNKLLKAIAQSRPDRPWHYTGIDPFSSQADVQKLDAGWLNDINGSFVIANELLDNLAFKVLEGREGESFGQLAVGQDNAVYLTECNELKPGQAELFKNIPAGRRWPLLTEAHSWVQAVLEHNPAHLLVFDYGVKATQELIDREGPGHNGWLRAYRNQQKSSNALEDILENPGHWDITTDIAGDQLPGAATFLTQAEFLYQWQIEQLVEQGRRHWNLHASSPDLLAIKMRSRVSEAEALTDPKGLGSFLCLQWFDKN